MGEFAVAAGRRGGVVGRSVSAMLTVYVEGCREMRWVGAAEKDLVVLTRGGNWKRTRHR